MIKDINNNPVRNILNIFVGIIIMLAGMMLVSSFSTENWASYIDIIPMALGLFYIASTLNLKYYIGPRSVFTFIISTCILVAFSISFSEQYVFSSNSAQELSVHVEHDWAYQMIASIANGLKNGEHLGDVLASLQLRQYQNTFAYSSLMFLFGGNVVTHICVWCGMHVAIIALFAFLIALRMGINNPKTLSFILSAAFLQPVFCAIYVYHRDTIGEAFLLLGVYIFTCTYEKPLRCLLFLPVYGFLFYSFRLQYLPVAFFLCFWAFLHKANVSSVSSIVLFFILVGLISVLSNSFLSVSDDLNIGNYIDNASKGNKGLFRSLLIGLFGYYPWTNLFKDPNWSYHYLICLQSVVNVGIWYNFIVFNKNRWSQVWYNPVCICALILTAFGFVSVGHVTYISVGTPLLLICLSGISFSKILKQYGVIMILFMITSFVYSALGLAGSGSL